MEQTPNLGLSVVAPEDRITNVLDWVHLLSSTDATSNMMILDQHIHRLWQAKEDKVVEADAKYFDIDYDGIVSLKPEYRGHPESVYDYEPLGAYPYAISDNGASVDGSKNGELPEEIVIPEVINGTAVAGFQPGIFQGNRRIQKLVLPETVTELPDAFCDNAWLLQEVANTEQVKVLGASAFRATRITKALFPNLRSWGDRVFHSCVLLHSVDIGDYVEDIKYRTFSACRSLSLIRGGASVKTIGEQAFYYATSLRNLPLLSHVTRIQDNAFVACRVSFDWPTIKDGCQFGVYAVPTIDNCVHKHTTVNTDNPNDSANYHPGCFETYDYWSGAKFTPCEQPLRNLMSQKNPEWVDDLVSQTGREYERGCATFSMLHIHAALSGKSYTHPDEFIAELESLGWPSTYPDGWIGYGDSTSKRYNAIPAAKTLGYSVVGNPAMPITRELYQELLDKLAFGAYAFIAMGTPNKPNAGHAFIIYGVNEIGEAMIADSDNAYNRVGLYHEGFTVQMPFQNFTGPKSLVVIIEKLDGLTARVSKQSSVLYVDGTDDVCRAEIKDGVLCVDGSFGVSIRDGVKYVD